MMNLDAAFADFNARYFAGRLPRYHVKRRRIMDLGRCDRRRRRIYVQAGQDDETETLLHEMIHAAVGVGHGERFTAELTRVQALGAPTNEDPSTYPPVPCAGQVREDVQDALREGATLREAQKTAAYNIGWTRAALVRRFPRAARGG